MRLLDLRSKSYWGPFLGMLAAMMGTIPSVCAQEVIMAPPSEPVLAPSLRQQVAPPPLSRPPAPPLSPYRLGPIELHPRLSYSHLLSNGLPVLGGRRITSEVRTVSAGLSADLGQHWSLDYSPSWVSYTANAMADSFNQSASLSGGLSFQDWSIQVSQNYSDSNPTLVETARQTEQQSWSTHLGASYNYSQKLKFNLSTGMAERSTNLTPTVRTWNAQPGIKWQISPRLDFDLGAGFKYSEIADAPDTYGENYNTKLNWQPTDKVTVGVGVGVQATHSTSATSQNLSSPVFDVSLGYQPFDTTTLTFGAARTVSTSYFKDLVTKNLRWNLGLQQRLLGRLYLNASYSRSDGDYIATNAQGAAGRTDRVESISTRLTTRLLKRLSVSATYQQSKNTSNLAAFTFSSNQYGVELGWSY